MDKPFEFIEIDEDSPIAQQLQRDKEEARVRYRSSELAKRDMQCMKEMSAKLRSDWVLAKAVATVQQP